MYDNLKAEMARNHISVKDISNSIGLSISGIYSRMSQKDKFRLSECKKIRNDFFPEMPLDYLFADGDDSPKPKILDRSA